MSILIHPDYFRIFECRQGQWFKKKAKMFWKALPNADYEDLQLLYGLSNSQILDGLESANNCKDGYYIANLRRNKYYYCGTDPECVDVVLEELGCGHPRSEA